MTTPACEQLTLLRTSAAVCCHRLRQLLAVSGDDARPWLERLLSRPVAAIMPGQSLPAVVMDGKGRLRADLRLLARGDPASGLLLDLPADEGQLLEWLQMFVIADDVTLAPADDLELLTVAGPASAQALSARGLPLPRDEELSEPRAGLALLTSRLAGGTAYDLLVARSALPGLLAELLAADLPPVDLPALDCLRIGHGVPWFAQDLAGGTIPLEALLDDHVSVTKGCYPGQEVIARITHRGQLSRKLARLTAESGQALAPGSPLLGTGPLLGRSAGQLTSSCVDPCDGSLLALGYLRRAFWGSGTRVDAAGQELTVSSLDGD